MTDKEILETLIERYPKLNTCYTDIWDSYQLLSESFANKKKLLICGNGGSASDAGHIVGELMKAFVASRNLDNGVKKRLVEINPALGKALSEKLQPALPAISLTSHEALISAFGNDVDPEFAFAQQVIGYGLSGDTLLCISTSGNSKNVILAAITAKAIGINVIALTGNQGGKLADYADIAIKIPETLTHYIQELHLPVYHALCGMLEYRFFNPS